jgi:hypothetical protein
MRPCGSCPAREVGEVYATGPTFKRLVEVAGRHGVKPAGEWGRL